MAKKAEISRRLAVLVYTFVSAIVRIDIVKTVTNCFENKILNEEIDSKSQLCGQPDETCHYLMSGCHILMKSEYLMRHDRVCAHLCYSICKALGIEITKKWYTHTHTPVHEHEDVTLLWNRGVHTYREVVENRQDIITNNSKEKSCILIDVTS
jgi:hypothetical protein